MNIQSAEIELPAKDLHADLAYYTKQLGFRLETIHPSDDPAVAVLSGFGLRLRLDKHSSAAPGTIHLTLGLEGEGTVQQPGEEHAPNGTRIVLQQQQTRVEIPPTRHSYQVRRLQDSEPWVIGRAGMMYRDLIGDRLGGSIIASHIRIPDGGPVPDMVHYHTIGFQLIYCLSGWVRLVYEDQGPPFILKAGDCVTQPPKIRHRVLEASDNLEVLEIGVPAHHMTTIDHEMDLPTAVHHPEREFEGQVFCHHQLQHASWNESAISGLQMCDSGVAEATRGLASVEVYRFAPSFAPTQADGRALQIKASSDIHFALVSKGEVTLCPMGEGPAAGEQSGDMSRPKVLSRGDAMVLPPDMSVALSDCSDDLEFIQVCIQ